MKRSMAGLQVVRDTDAVTSHQGWGERIQRVLNEPGLVLPHFQSIIDLGRGVVAGYELLSRFDLPDGQRPFEWFAAAEQHGMVEALDATVLEAAIQRLPELPQNTFLTVNVTSLGAASPLVGNVIERAGSIAGLVVELTEQTALDDPFALVEFTKFVRTRGGMIAVDDVGTGYSSLQRVMALRPEFVKIDRSFVSSLHTDEAKVAAVEMMGKLADRIDGWVIAEGVEEIPELDRLAQLGVPLAQGFLFSRPQLEPPMAVDQSLVQRLITLNEVDDCEVAPLVEMISPECHPVTEEQIQVRFAVDSGLDYLPTLDSLDRPHALMRRPRTGEGSRIGYSPMKIHPGATVAQVARRAMARAASERFTPLVYCNEEGKYVGLLRIERLIEGLAPSAGPDPR